MLELAISGIEAKAGPTTVPTIESAGRSASVRLLSGATERLDYGQNQITEPVAITAHWSRTISRDTVLEEWQSFSDALLADQILSDSVVGLIEAHLSEAAWSEAHDSSILTMTAIVETVRIE